MDHLRSRSPRIKSITSLGDEAVYDGRDPLIAPIGRAIAKASTFLAGLFQLAREDFGLFLGLYA